MNANNVLISPAYFGRPELKSVSGLRFYNVGYQGQFTIPSSSCLSPSSFISRRPDLSCRYFFLFLPNNLSNNPGRDDCSSPEPASLPDAGALTGTLFSLQYSHAAEPGSQVTVRFGQFTNAMPPIFVTLSGIVIDVRFVQPSNALTSISVTLSGIARQVRLVQL